MNSLLLILLLALPLIQALVALLSHRRPLWRAGPLLASQIPLALGALVSLMASGTLNLTVLSLQQAGGFHHWLLFHDPFNVLAFLMFSLGLVALMQNRKPSPAGLFSHPTLWLLAALQAALWLGAWYDPFGILCHLEHVAHPAATGQIAAGSAGGAGSWAGINWPLASLAILLGTAIFFLKTCVLVILLRILRRMFPRLRSEQVLHICINILLPIGCCNLVAASAYLWLVEPLAQVQTAVEILLAIFALPILLASLALICYPYLHRLNSPISTPPRS